MRIYSQNIGIEFAFEKYSKMIMKSGKQQMTGGIEVPTWKKIGTLGVKKAYKYLDVEAETIKHTDMKEKNHEKNTSGEREKYLKTNNLVEKSSKR